MMLTIHTLFNDPNIVNAVIQRVLKTRKDTIYWQQYLGFRRTTTRVFKDYIGQVTGVMAGSINSRYGEKPIRERRNIGSGYGEIAYLGDRYQISIDRLSDLQDLIDKYNAAKPENECIYYSVDEIHNAIQEKRQITFQYYEYTPQKEKILKHNGYRYQFSPYALIWSRDCYYAVGWSEKHGKIAQFRVDRMTAVEPLEHTAVQTPDFDPAEYVRKVFGMYPDNLCTVELLCDNEVMRSVIDRFGENVQTETVDEQHFRATVEVAPSPPFFSWVFTFSGKIRIVSPAAVLEEMRDMAAWLK